MSHFRYIIIGGGIAADSAINGIREIDQTGNIGMIGKEKFPPYNRPPLSKGLWKNEPEDILWRKTSRSNVQSFLGRTVTSIDIKNKKITDDHNEAYSYDKLLLATGGKVNKPFPDIDGIIYYRTYEDYRRLRELTSVCNEFAVVGGGFIGAEIAAALSVNGKKVTMIIPEEGIGGKIFPLSLSQFLIGYYREKGVQVITGRRVQEIKKQGNAFLLRTNSGSTLMAEAIVAGTGISPDTDLAEDSGIKTGNGIVVDEFLQTSVPDIYAAGDVANYFSRALNKNIRVEHEDNSNAMGALAGRNMAGTKQAYHHVPFFYSDLFDLGYEAVGELDSRYETVDQWKEEFREGTIYYLNDKKVRGVLLWNNWGQVENARAMIGNRLK